MEEQEQYQVPTESETVEDPSAENDDDDVFAQEGSTSSESGLDEKGILVVTDIERTEETIFNTASGKIHVIHEITLGDVITSILLAAVIVFMFLDRVIRR